MPDGSRDSGQTGRCDVTHRTLTSCCDAMTADRLIGVDTSEPIDFTLAAYVASHRGLIPHGDRSAPASRSGPFGDAWPSAQCARRAEVGPGDQRRSSRRSSRSWPARRRAADGGVLTAWSDGGPDAGTMPAEPRDRPGIDRSSPSTRRQASRTGASSHAGRDCTCRPIAAWSAASATTSYARTLSSTTAAVATSQAIARLELPILDHGVRTGAATLDSRPEHTPARLRLARGRRTTPASVRSSSVRRRDRSRRREPRPAVSGWRSWLEGAGSGIARVHAPRIVGRRRAHRQPRRHVPRRLTSCASTTTAEDVPLADDGMRYRTVFTTNSRTRATHSRRPAGDYVAMCIASAARRRRPTSDVLGVRVSCSPTRQPCPERAADPVRSGSRNGTRLARKWANAGASGERQSGGGGVSGGAGGWRA